MLHAVNNCGNQPHLLFHKFRWSKRNKSRRSGQWLLILGQQLNIAIACRRVDNSHWCKHPLLQKDKLVPGNKCHLQHCRTHTLMEDMVLDKLQWWGKERSIENYTRLMGKLSLSKSYSILEPRDKIVQRLQITTTQFAQNQFKTCALSQHHTEIQKSSFMWQHQSTTKVSSVKTTRASAWGLMKSKY